MSRISFKACPKCHGDLYLDWDVFNERHQSCLQCGYTTYLDTRTESKDENANEKSKKPEAVCIK